MQSPQRRWVRFPFRIRPFSYMHSTFLLWVTFTDQTGHFPFQFICTNCQLVEVLKPCRCELLSRLRKVSTWPGCGRVLPVQFLPVNIEIKNTEEGIRKQSFPTLDIERRQEDTRPEIQHKKFRKWPFSAVFVKCVQGSQTMHAKLYKWWHGTEYNV